MSEPATTAVRVWDLPTRVFHWLLAAAVCVSFATAWIGGNAIVWHMRCGLAVLALLLFRVVWGLIGGRWSRFASFVYAPRTVRRYLRGEARAGEHLDVGHNPLGSLSVFALLGLLALQVGTGLVADDEIATQGPLNRYVSNAQATAATSWHRIEQWLLLALVVLHLGAIAFYRWRRHVDLVRPMLHGDKALPPATPASVDSAVTRAFALLVFGLCVGVATWVARGAP